MPNIKIRDGQCLLDIAIQCAGAADAAFALAVLNGRSVTDDLAAGESITTGPIADGRVAGEFRNRGLFPASNPSAVALAPSGIDYMAIGVDFLIF